MIVNGKSFGDSPVFNYISSLSPIKPVKSLHITQTFSSLSFGSHPSVFTSPHVSSNKESRFLRRYNTSDQAKPEVSSENGVDVPASDDAVIETVQVYNNSVELRENCKSDVNVEEASAGPQNEGSAFVIELPRVLKYDCGSPDCVSTPHDVVADFESNSSDPSANLVPHVQVAPQIGPSDNEAQIQEVCLSEPKKQGAIVVQVEKITKALREFGGYDFMATILERNLQSVQTYCDEFLFFVDRQNRFTIYGNNTITLFVPPDEAIRFKEWNSFDYQIVMSKVDREAFELGHLSKGSTLVPASVKQKLIVDEVRDDGTVLINRVELNHWNIYNDGHVIVHGTENFFNHLWEYEAGIGDSDNTKIRSSAADIREC
uniref:Uncharacterized protein n=1 Tax=Cannabis sativa TaxID=3483 RepID=A0A803PLJ0_CANSA